MSIRSPLPYADCRTKTAIRFEAKFGRVAYAHLFVTRAMHDFLVKEWKLQYETYIIPLLDGMLNGIERGHKAVLHDRPPAHFHPATAFETHEVTTLCSQSSCHSHSRLQLFLRISPSLPVAFLPAYNLPVSTPLTQVTSSALPSLRSDRPAVLVSSTSWTEDEDFSILLDALSIYEHRARAARGKLPRVLMFVTGKGPLRETYMRKARGLQDGEDGERGPWQWVHITSTWLEPKDYPLLLGRSSLHFTSHPGVNALKRPWTQGLPI